MAEKSYFRFIHLSPRTAAVNIIIDEKKIVKDIGYTDSSDYIEMEPGGHSLILTRADGTALLDPVDVDLESGKYYTVTATGLTRGQPSLKLVMYEDEPLGKVA